MVSALITAIATIEFTNQPGAPFGRGALGVYQGVHLLAPSLSLFGKTQLAQIMCGAEDFGKPHQFIIIGPMFFAVAKFIAELRICLWWRQGRQANKQAGKDKAEGFGYFVYVGHHSGVPD